MATPLRKSTAGQVVQFTMVDSSDFKTPKTGLSIANTDIKLIFEAGTTQTSKNSGGATEIGSTGTYYMTLDATDTATLGRLHIDIQKSGALPYWKDTEVLPTLVWDALYASSGGAIMSDLQTVKTQTVTCAGGVTIPAATLASTTNITAGTITTTTNLTNAPASGDLTAAMKSSVTIAATAATPTIAATQAFNNTGQTTVLPADMTKLNGSATAAASLAAAYSRPYVWVPASTTSYTLIAGAAAGSVVSIDPSATHAWGNHNVPRLADGVTVEGNGARISSSADLNVKGTIIGPGDRCTVKNLRFTGTSTTIFQAALGWNDGLNGQSPATDVVFENCSGESDTDFFFFNWTTPPATPTRITIRGCTPRTKFDCLYAGASNYPATGGWENWYGLIILEDNDFDSEGPSVVDPGDGTARGMTVSGVTVIDRGSAFRASGAALVNTAVESDNAAGPALVILHDSRLYATGANNKSASQINAGDPAIVPGVGDIRGSNISANPALPTTVTLMPTSASRVSGTKQTLDALNDIPASAIVSNGAINTSSGAVTTVASVTGNVAGSVGSVSNIVAQTADVGARIPANLVMTSGKVWALDGSGNALAPASAAAAIQGKTDQLTFTTANVVDASGGGGGTGSGDTPVTGATLDDEGDDMLAKTSGGTGIDDVVIRAYVKADYLANPATASVIAETRSVADGTWQDALMLDSGVTFRINFSKSGYTFESTEVTP